MNENEIEDKLFNDLNNHIQGILGYDEITSDWFYDKFMELHSLKSNIKLEDIFINDKNDFMKKSRQIKRTIFLAYLLREAIKIKSMFMLLFVAIYIGFWYTLDALYVTTISYTFSFFLMYYMYYRCEADRK